MFKSVVILVLYIIYMDLILVVSGHLVVYEKQT